MQAFMDQDFLLNTPTARTLFHDVAAKCPIIDYHCHISPREIYEDMRYENITQVWLGADHYKWRLMRCAGVNEKYITGDASDYEKFCKWAEVVGKAIGNPLYHWSHLELQRFFGYYGALSAKTADEVWNACNARLQSAGYSVRGLIAMSNVETICTTDDPIDNLEWHQRLLADKSFETNVWPAWRPDKAVNIEKPDFMTYIGKLAEAAGMEIKSFADMKTALIRRMEYFHANHCCLSDHGLSYVGYAPASEETIEAIFAKKASGGVLTETEVAKFKTACMMFFASQYKRLNWTMQLHYNVRRDNNLTQFAKLGPDTGFDTINNYAPVDELAGFLGAVEAQGNLPQTILYSLNPADNAAIDTLCGCFQNDEAVSKVQHGSGWWFNDHFQGMTDQLTSLANLGYLAGFVGMLTDSRSFLSYPRHEYFRRILCRLLGEWVEDGRFPADMELLGEIVRGVCCDNARRYFRFAQK
ncbi:MAG: glucuronate isomerase [Clostridia bacterium]|nr:glucuronate isomerase [Clostridia bacterium]